MSFKLQDVIQKTKEIPAGIAVCSRQPLARQGRRNQHLGFQGNSRGTGGGGCVAMDDLTTSDPLIKKGIFGGG